MNFDEIEQAWQNQKIPHIDDEKLIPEVKNISSKLYKKAKRNAIIWGLVSSVCLIAILFWAYLFVFLGIQEMREKDIYPPLGAMVFVPLYLFCIGGYVVHNFFKQKNDYKISGESLKSFLGITLKYVIEKIVFLRVIILLYVGGVIGSTIIMQFTPEFNLWLLYPVGTAIAFYIPDAILISILFFYCRYKIKNTYQPYKSVLIGLLEEIKAK